MAKASELIKLAQSWVGKKTSDGSHREIIDIYNSHKPLARGYAVKYNDAWCATTITALAIKCNATDIIPKECGCGQMIELFKKLGSWVENDSHTPKAGDIIFYDWQDSGSGDNVGWSDHVGIVEKVEGNTITIIEGNYNNAVRRRSLQINGKYIRGYGVPKYEAEVVAPAKTIDDWAQEIVDGKHGIGHDNRQASLKKAGCPYDYQAIRAIVNAIFDSKPASEYYPAYNGSSSSIDQVFKAIGVPSKFIGNWAKRKPVASANNIPNYTGTASQNITLRNLARAGKLKKA